jgi:hypothetical protein
MREKYGEIQMIQGDLSWEIRKNPGEIQGDSREIQENLMEILDGEWRKNRRRDRETRGKYRTSWNERRDTGISGIRDTCGRRSRKIRRRNCGIRNEKYKGNHEKNGYIWRKYGRMGGEVRRDPGEKKGKRHLQEDTRKCREICDDR